MHPLFSQGGCFVCFEWVMRDYGDGKTNGADGTNESEDYDY